MRILSKNTAATVDLPVERSRKACIVFEGQKIGFERTDAGTIQVDFPKQ